MALPSRYGIDKNINSMEGLSAYENGGKGSGNFGHAGRPGEVGGSSSEGEIGGKYEKRKDYKAEQKGVEVRDGHSISTEFADLEAQLSTARTNLKMLKKDSEKAYDDLAGRNRYLTRQSEIARAFSQARALGKSKLSTETKKLVKEMEIELRSIMADYIDLGTKKYFDPDLNVER